MDEQVIFYTEREKDTCMHAVVHAKDFPVSVRYKGKIYCLVMSRRGKLRLGDMQAEGKKVQVGG